MTPAEERRNRLVKALAEHGQNTPDWIDKQAKIMATTKAAITNDIFALTQGAIPGAADNVEVTKDQLKIADLVEAATTEELVDEAMRRLCGHSLRRPDLSEKVLAEVKCAAWILNMRRYWLAALRGGKDGLGNITAIPGAPATGAPVLGEVG